MTRLQLSPTCPHQSHTGAFKRKFLTSDELSRTTGYALLAALRAGSPVSPEKGLISVASSLRFPKPITVRSGKAGPANDPILWINATERWHDGEDTVVSQVLTVVSSRLLPDSGIIAGHHISHQAVAPSITTPLKEAWAGQHSLIVPEAWPLGGALPLPVVTEPLRRSGKLQSVRPYHSLPGGVIAMILELYRDTSMMMYIPAGTYETAAFFMAFSLLLSGDHVFTTAEDGRLADVMLEVDEAEGQVQLPVSMLVMPATAVPIIEHLMEAAL